MRGGRARPGTTQSVVECTRQVVGVLSRRSGVDADHDPGPLRHRLHTLTHEVTQLTPHTIATHRAWDLPLGHDETDEALRGVLVGPAVHDDHGIPRTGSAADRAPEVLGIHHAVRARQHLRRSQAESLARPLRRRLARMERPARVDMRRRKPCTLERRRVLGWKVRLVTTVLLGERGRPPVIRSIQTTSTEMASQGAVGSAHGRAHTGVQPRRLARARQRDPHGPPHPHLWTRRWTKKSTPVNSTAVSTGLWTGTIRRRCHDRRRNYRNVIRPRVLHNSFPKLWTSGPRR